jgi:hypothetical protein
MKSVNELLVLFMRQVQLERAMKQQRGGDRVAEEQELHAMRQELAAFSETAKTDAVVRDDDRV